MYGVPQLTPPLPSHHAPVSVLPHPPLSWTLSQFRVTDLQTPTAVLVVDVEEDLRLSV